MAELVPGAPIPESVYAREGKSFDELWTNPMRGLDQMEVAVQGFRDQEGYPLVKLSKLDVVAQLAHNRILMGIWVGASVRTNQGTGKGSTRAELEAAHGPLSQYDMPEPYHCILGGSELKHVTFLFREHCSEVQASTPCAAVYVGGYEEPEEVPLHEQPYCEPGPITYLQTRCQSGVRRNPPVLTALVGERVYLVLSAPDQVGWTAYCVPRQMV